MTGTYTPTGVTSWTRRDSACTGTSSCWRRSGPTSAMMSNTSEFIVLVVDIQSVPKKMQFLGILAITPLWKGLELKVGGVSKTS